MLVYIEIHGFVPFVLWSIIPHRGKFLPRVPVHKKMSLKAAEGAKAHGFPYGPSVPRG